MKNDNVILFPDKLKKQDKSAIGNTPEELAQDIFNRVAEQIKKQKEDIEFWHEVLNDLHEECETVIDFIRLASFLSLYSTEMLTQLIDGSSHEISEAIRLSIIETNKPLNLLIDKLDKKTKKE